MQSTPLKTPLPNPGLLRWEIAIALIVKIMLLVGLWFLIFRWMDKPAVKADVAAHFNLPAANAAVTDFSSQPPKESSHVR